MTKLPAQRKVPARERHQAPPYRRACRNTSTTPSSSAGCAEQKLSIMKQSDITAGLAYPRPLGCAIEPQPIAICVATGTAQFSLSSPVTVWPGAKEDRHTLDTPTRCFTGLKKYFRAPQSKSGAEDQRRLVWAQHGLTWCCNAPGPSMDLHAPLTCATSAVSL